MLHNSLLRRDRLREMNAHPLVLQRRDVHRNVGVTPGSKPAANQIELIGRWSVQSVGTSPADKAVVADAEDFLKRLNVKIDTTASNSVRFKIDPSINGFTLAASQTSVAVTAGDASSLWAGWIHLENQMRTNGAAILSLGSTRREPAWEVQIAPPTWGANYSVPDLSPEYLGDDTFRSLAHAGANGLFIYGDFLLYAAGTRFKELNHPDADKYLTILRETTERAQAYGIRLYFVAVSPKLPADHALFKNRPGARGALLHHEANSPAPAIHCLCSSSEDALGFHADVFGHLFRTVPELGGVILIIGGESYYHCFMRSAGSKIGETNCPQCKGKLAEDVIAKLLSVTSESIHAQSKDAYVMAWPYSAHGFWSKEPNQLELIDRLPAHVSLLSEIDKEQTVMRGKHPKLCWDYTVDFDGHSDRIVSQAMRANARNRGLFIKTETSHGIELLHLPYAPAIGRSANQWQSIRALRPTGVLQRWGFIGMFDSVAERVGCEARWNPNFAPAAATQQVARTLAGSAAPTIVEAWKHFDESVHHIPVLTTGPYYTGPGFLGPCHPLPTWDPKSSVPDAFKGELYYLQEVEATFSGERIARKDNLAMTSTAVMGNIPPADIEAEFALARDAASQGHDILKSIDATKFPAHIQSEIIEQQAIGEYLYRSYRATVNSIRFIRLIEEAKDDRNAIKDQLIPIAKDELENAELAKKVYERAPWLNHNLRLDMGGPDSVAMIDEKIRLLKTYLNDGGIIGKSA